MEIGSRGQSVPFLPKEGAAVEIGHEAPGFLDEKGSCRRVPGGEPKLEKPVEDTRCRVGEVESRASRAPQDLNGKENLAKNSQIGVDSPMLAKRESGGQGRAGQSGPRRHLQPFSIPKSALASFGPEQISLHGIRNHGGFDTSQPPPGRSRDGDGPVGKSTDEIGRAVKRIDDPDGGTVIFARRPELFPQKMVRRKSAQEERAADLFAFAVRPRNDVVLGLLLDPGWVKRTEIAQEEFACFFSRAPGCRERFGHGFLCA